MKKQLKLKLIAVAMTMACTNYGFGQATDGLPGTGNLFGPNKFLGWNNTNGANPLFIRTNSLNRITVAQLPSGSALVNTGGVGGLFGTNNVPGFGMTRIGISYDGANPIFAPQSLLHLGEQSPGSGIRDWMGIGMFISMDSDHAFFGHRVKNGGDITGRTSIAGSVSTGNDLSDAVIGFGDNANGPTGIGTDNLTFIHTDVNTGASSSAGPNFQNSNYGREIVRMTGIGNVGIGPVFFDNAQPQNMLHINNNLNIPVYMQISNQTGTGQSGADGFHLGITGTGIAELNQRENLDMRFFTFGNQRAVIKNNGLVGINTNAPANRVEISAAGGDPYFATNNASGLMFTNLTSAKNVVPLGAGVTNTKLLSVDGAGNVIMVAAPNSVPTANQGLIVTGANVQLGGLCTGALPQITGGTRGIDLNGNNFVWRNGLTGFNLAGCTPGNVVEITSTTPIGSGLRFTNLTNATPAGFASLVQANGKVLAVNVNGDVILVPAPGGQVSNGLSINTSGTVPVIEFGAQCSDFTGQFNSRFLNNRAQNLNNFNMFFYSTANSTSGIAVGGVPASSGPNPPPFCNVANTFEISANNAGKYGNTNASGLRLTKLKSTSPTAPLGGVNQVVNTKVLSVDKDGDVVLVPAATGLNCWDLNGNGIFDVGTEDFNGNGIADAGDCKGPIGLTGPVGPAGPAGGIVNAQNGLSLLNPTTVEFGGPAGAATAAQLLNNREVPMNNNQILFTQNGNIRVGQILNPFPAGILPTFNIDNSNNTTNNVSALIFDFCGNGTSNRKALDIKMNLNTPAPDVIALNVEHANNSLAQGDGLSSKLISAKGLDWNSNGIQDDEVFGVRSAGYAGFGLQQNYYGIASLGIGDYNNSSPSLNPLTNHYGRHSLFVYNNKDNGQNVRNADFYAEGSQYIDGVVSTAKVNGFYGSLALAGIAIGNNITQQGFEANYGVFGRSNSPSTGKNISSPFFV